MEHNADLITVSMAFVENQVSFHATTQAVRMTRDPLGCDILLFHSVKNLLYLEYVHRC